MRILLILLWVLLTAGASRSFDGVNDEVDFGDVPAIDDATALTVACWAYYNNITSDHTNLSTFSASDNDGFLFWFDDSAFTSGRTDVISVRVERSTTTALIEGATNSGKANTWQRIAFTFLASTASTGLHLYIDGAEDANSPTGTAGISSARGVSRPVQAGLDGDSGRDHDGFLAYLQVWDRVLTLEEIEQALFFPGSVPDSLVLYAPLWGEDSPELDLSGNGNTGTVTGATEGAEGPPISLAGALPL